MHSLRLDMALYRVARRTKIYTLRCLLNRQGGNLELRTFILETKLPRRNNRPEHHIHNSGWDTRVPNEAGSAVIR